MFEVLTWQSSWDAISHSVFMFKLLHQQSLYERCWKALGAIFFLLSHMHVRIVIQEISTIVCYPTLHSEALYMRGELLLRAVSPTYLYLIQVEEARLCQQSNNCSVYALLSLLELLNRTWCFLEMWFFFGQSKAGSDQWTSAASIQAWLLKINGA